jgi:TolB-like protein/Tfp pilus assembly protein PilF
MLSRVPLERLAVLGEGCYFSYEFLEKFSAMGTGRHYEFGRYRLDAEGHLLFRNGERMVLTPKALDLLIALVEAQGNLIGKEELLKRVWPSTVVEEGSLTSHISLLRRVLRGTGEFIETIPKRGYRFIGAVKQTERAEVLASATRLKLVVLPFENLSVLRKHDYFSDGLTEEMITQLARLNPERLGVIARTSAMQYRSTAKTIEQIGRELQVSHVLEGSVRRAGKRVRVTAQLVQVSDQTHLWAESYERGLRDILRVQGDLARAIAEQIEVNLNPVERARLETRHRVDPEAYESYLKGRYLWNRRTPAALRQATRLFERAVAQDPQSALAWAALADCYLVPGTWSWLAPRYAAVNAARAARKALECDATLAAPHASLGMVLSLFERRFREGEQAFRRALELNPNYATAHHWFSFHLAAQGRHSEALAEIRKALELDPLSSIIHTNLGTVLYWARQYDAAIEQYRETLALNDNFWTAHWMLGLALEQTQQHAQAAKQQRRAIETLPGQSSLLLASLARAQALAGARREARRLLREIERSGTRTSVAWFHTATAYLALEDVDKAFGLLYKACKECDVWVVFMKVDPRLDPLRRDPRYPDLLARAGLGD